MLYSQEAESNVLGSILTNNDSICKIIDLLEPKDFYNNANKLIYSEIKTMYENSKAVDITTLAVSLGERLKEVGGITYLAEISGQVVNAKNIKSYADIVKDKSILRTLKNNLYIAQKKIEDEAAPGDIIKFLQDNTMTIKNDANEDGNINKAIEGFLDDLQRRYENGGDIQGIKTHYASLDSILGGFHGQELIIVGARPSMGKSVYATNLGVNIGLRSKKKVAIFSLEMNSISLVKRMVCNLTNIDSYNLRDGKITSDEWAKIGEASGVLSTDNLKLYERTMTLNGIIAECKKLKIQNGLDVVIIDYLQLIQGNSKENRVQEVSDISRKLKLIAKELNITVIALSQLSRKVEERTDKRPMLADLRESGSIEQDADVVMFLYRDEYYDPETEDKGILEVIVAKQRDGEVGIIKLAWLPQFQKIGNLDYVHAGSYNPEIFKK